MSDRVKNIVVTVILAVFVICMLVINILKKDTIISTSERRKLASFPEFSVSKLLDGRFVNQFEKYTMDQFIGRESFRHLKSIVEFKCFGKNDVNNLYEYKGTIVKQEYPLNEKSINNTINKMKKIKELYLKNNNIYYSIVPDKNYYVDDKYLKIDYSKLEKMMTENLDGMEYIRIFDCLTLDDYYYSDTHWKQECLGKVVSRISEKMNFDDRIKTRLEEKEVTKFKGVYAGQLQMGKSEDTIRVLTNNIINESRVYNFETNSETEVYNLECINNPDKYDIFLSGATPLLVISNVNAKTNKELIVFRDSFGSSLVPLFIEGYSKITVIDTRYIATQYLGEYVHFDGKDVLFLYSTLVINNSSALK